MKSTIKKIMHGPRKRFYKRLQKKLKNPCPTIISNDCIGGMIYHNLNLKFMSPTINLYISKKDFFTFVNNLTDYLNAELKEETNKNKSYPIGTLEFNNQKISIKFMHYKTFEEAKNKWNERKKRVDFNNIFIILSIPSNLQSDDIKKFNLISFKNKMLITYENPTNNNNICVNSVFLKNYYSGKILSYKSKFSTKRYMDDIDYVKFLNNNTSQ